MYNLRQYNKPIRKADCFEFCLKSEAEWYVHGNRPWLLRPPEDVTANMRGYYGKGSQVLATIPKSHYDSLGKSSVSGGVYWMNTQEMIEAYEQFKTLQT
jgi:hypothetical protein